MRARARGPDNPNTHLTLSSPTYTLCLIHFQPSTFNFPLLYPLKTQENRRFSGVFRVYRSGTLVENMFNNISCTQRRIQNPVKHLRQSFLRKQLMAEYSQLLLQKATSQMFDLAFLFSYNFYSAALFQPQKIALR